MRTIVWFRGKDLRLGDHAPLAAAIADGEVLPLFVLDPFFFDPERARALPHRMQFLLASLACLRDRIGELGSRLLLVRGRSVDVVPQLFRMWKADRVVAHRWVEPFGRERDRRISEAIGGRLHLYEGETLLPPGTLKSASGRPHVVFSPFARAFLAAIEVAPPIAAPTRLPPLPALPSLPSVPPLSHRAPLSAGEDVTPCELPSCRDLGLEPNANLLEGGEPAADGRLSQFIKTKIDAYQENRDRLDEDGTSRLSADLKFGTISIRQVWTRVRSVVDSAEPGPKAFLRELIWREFTHNILWERPDVLEHPFRPDFEGFPWTDDRKLLELWAAGETGYPVVDAASRQLLCTGFVHNRARMIAASFLTKHLLVHYRHGEAHYMKYLVDGDWAQNNAGWQWSSGSGCDAQPYFRVFNPIKQGRTFDPDGAYVRRWVPELADLPTRYIHAPFEAPSSVLGASGVELGATYPRPIVEHAEGRARFLATAAAHLRRTSSKGKGQG